MGIARLYHSMHLSLEKPVLYCDNRAAVHISPGSSEWRTKALVNRILGVRSLIELGYLGVQFMPTADMQADALTQFLSAKGPGAPAEVGRLRPAAAASLLPVR